MNRIIMLPIVVRSPQSKSSPRHWAAKGRQAKQQREAARLLMLRERRPVVQITLRRIAPRVMDNDNLATALKHVRDGIADAFGMTDGSPLVEWKYEQARSAKGSGIEVRVGLRDGCSTPDVRAL